MCRAAALLRRSPPPGSSRERCDKTTGQTAGYPQQTQPALVTWGTSILDQKGQVAFANSLSSPWLWGGKNPGLISLTTIFQATSSEKKMGNQVKIIQVSCGLTSAMLPSPLSSQLLSPTISGCSCGGSSASGGDGHTDR